MTRLGLRDCNDTHRRCRRAGSGVRLRPLCPLRRRLAVETLESRLLLSVTGSGVEQGLGARAADSDTAEVAEIHSTSDAGTTFIDGVLRPGNSPGIVTYGGDVSFSPTATVEIELGGTTAGTEHDKVVIAGQASLDGTLEVVLIDGFEPLLGHPPFEVITFADRNGTSFANYVGLDLVDLDSVVLKPVYTDTSLTLQVVPAPAVIEGMKFDDLDGDGNFEPADGETGLEGWKIYVDENDNGRWDTGEPFDLTGAEGNYALAGLAPGTHQVAEVQQPGFEQTFPLDGKPGTGKLTFVDALFDGQTEGQPNPIEGMDDPQSVAVSPDGKHVYPAALSSHSLAVFSRDGATGELTLVEALFDGGRDGHDNPIDGLRGAYSVTVSPGGEYVYAAGTWDHAVAVFHRNVVTGRLTFVETLRNSSKDYAGNAITWMARPTDVLASLDGRHVYVTAGVSHSLTALSRAPQGLRLIHTLRNGQPDGNGVTVVGLDGANSVTQSPDGLSVYVAAQSDGALSVFHRDPLSDELTFLQVLRDGQPDAQGNLVDGLAMAWSVIVSPDGSHVYSAGYADRAVAVFSRNPNSGKLTFVEVLKNDLADEQGNTINGLSQVQDVTLSADGNHVYTASLQDALTTFRRDGRRDVHLVELVPGQVGRGINFGNHAYELRWDGQGDGNWDDIDQGTGYSRWLDADGNPLTMYPDNEATDAVLRTDVVTASGDRQARDLLVESGTLAIDNDVTIGLAGSFNASGAATLAIQMGGDTTGLIHATGSANLGGSLVLEATDNLGNLSAEEWGAKTRVIIEADDAVNGTFTTEPTVYAPANYKNSHIGYGAFHHDVDYDANTVTVDLFQAGPGDANGDAQFNFSDLVTMFSESGAHYGNTDVTDLEWTGGDFNGDGSFTFADLVTAFSSLGAHYGGDAYAAPPAPLMAEEGVAEVEVAVPSVMEIDANQRPSHIRRAAAFDVALQQPVEREPLAYNPSLSELSWMSDYERMAGRNRAGRTNNSAETAVDNLLAT